MSSIVRFTLSRLAPRGPASRLLILIFHRVLSAPDPLRPGEPTAEDFEHRLRWLKARFNIISLAEAVAGLRAGRLPARPLAITFDDGYADNHDLAAPLLAKLGLTATFFVASGYLDGGVMFNDLVIEAVRAARGEVLDLEAIGLGRHDIASPELRLAAVDRLLGVIKYRPSSERARLAREVAEACGLARIPTTLMMSSSQVQALAAMGMTIGGHTVTHPILREVDVSTARHEMAEGKAVLERLTGQAVTLFAYPNGRPNRDYGLEHVRLAEELGFEAAVSTAPGAARVQVDLYQLPRFMPWSWKRGRAEVQLARNLLRSPDLLPRSKDSRSRLSPAPPPSLEGAE
jgi:peptidoglycan/xylan/chitin deacetylase (PgdA/CDA1 family)